MLHLIWTIPLLPLLGVAINGLWGRRMSRQAVGLVACAAIAAALLVAVGAVWELSQMPEHERHFVERIATWMPLGSIVENGPELDIGWTFALDPL